MERKAKGRPIGIPDGLTLKERARLMMGDLLKNLNEGALAEEARRKAEKPENQEQQAKQ